MCDGEDYQHGPLTVMVDQIVHHCHQYSFFSTGHYGFVSKKVLSSRKDELNPSKKSVRLPGKKRRKETQYYFNNARALARVAKERQQQLHDEVTAVLFRDCDGTASAARGLWDDKRQSILDGFAAEAFTRGVPMLPKPKSEAWIICALKYKYQHCDVLEERSGNDNAPNSLKHELALHLDAAPDRQSLCEKVASREIDVDRIEMASFKSFRERLEEVI